MNQYVDEAADDAKEAVYQYKLQLNEDIERGAQVLGLYIDPTIDGRTHFATVRGQAYQILSPERLARLCQHLAGEALFDEAAFEWQAVDRYRSH